MGENDPGAINDHLAGMLEVYRDLAADHRLHLSEPPVGALRMADEHSRLQKLVHRFPPLGRRESMTGDAADLAALVSARLCHDLISPIGAIGNGLELLELAGHQMSPELLLVSDSLATALAKLRFFRIAFGPADPEAHLPREEAAQICAAMFNGRLNVAWTVPGDLPRPLARLACLAILCLEKSLPMGGTLEVSAPSPDLLALRASGRRVAAPTDLWAHVETGAPIGELRPDAVQFALLSRGLAETGARLSTRFDETGAELALAVLSPQPAEARP